MLFRSGPRHRQQSLPHGYYWPTAKVDAEDLVLRCRGCQHFAKQSHLPASALKTIPITWPFAVWGLDMVGRFKMARGGMTHLLVMVDKFTKWIEVKPIKKLDGKTAVAFLEDIINHLSGGRPLVGSRWGETLPSACIVGRPNQAH